MYQMDLISRTLQNKWKRIIDTLINLTTIIRQTNPLERSKTRMSDFLSYNNRNNMTPILVNQSLIRCKAVDRICFQVRITLKGQVAIKIWRVSFFQGETNQ